MKKIDYSKISWFYKYGVYLPYKLVKQKIGDYWQKIDIPDADNSKYKFDYSWVTPCGTLYNFAENIMIVRLLGNNDKVLIEKTVELFDCPSISCIYAQLYAELTGWA